MITVTLTTKEQEYVVNALQEYVSESPNGDCRHKARGLQGGAEE